MLQRPEGTAAGPAAGRARVLKLLGTFGTHADTLLLDFIKSLALLSYVPGNVPTQKVNMKNSNNKHDNTKEILRRIRRTAITTVCKK